MSLGEKDLTKDDLGGGDVMPFVSSCSICLEAVRDKGDRSIAKLQCGHEFHLGMQIPKIPNFSFHDTFKIFFFLEERSNLGVSGGGNEVCLTNDNVIL